MTQLTSLSLDELKLRGLGAEFNTFERLFSSLSDAQTAVATGDYIPTPGIWNAVIIIGQGIMVWSFDINDFVLINELVGAGAQADRYIDMDGQDDYIAFPTLNGGTADALDFTKSWTIGMTFVGVDAPTSAQKINLFGRGGVKITLNAQQGSSNWGLYVTSDNDLYNSAKRAQANTWYAPGDFTRILLTYNATEKKLRYYAGEPGTSYGIRSTLTIPQTMIDGQNITGDLEIGKAWSGVGGAGFSGYHLNAGIDNFIVSDIAFGSGFVEDYFMDVSGDPEAPASDSFMSAEYYADLVAFCKLGEDTFPDVTDQKGNLVGGALVNGTADDFKDIPTV